MVILKQSMSQVGNILSLKLNLKSMRLTSVAVAYASLTGRPEVSWEHEFLTPETHDARKARKPRGPQWVHQQGFE